MTLSIAYYVSDYGYGHAARSIAIIRELLRQTAEAGETLHLHVASGRALPFLERSLTGAFERERGGGHRLFLRQLEQEPGYCLRPGSMQADLPRLQSRVLSYLAELPKRIRKEAGWLSASGINLTVSDITAEAFPASRRAGIPSVGVSNFTWYTAYQEMLPAELLAPLGKAYLDMDAFIALAGSREPHWGLKPAARAGFFCRHADPGEVQELRKRLDPGGERLLIGLFPGMGIGKGSPLEKLPLLKDTRWLPVVSSGMELPDTALEAARIPDDETESQLYMAACDIVLTKPGWGTVAEAVCHGKPLALLERSLFREDRCTVEALIGKHPFLLLQEDSLAAPDLNMRLQELAGSCSRSSGIVPGRKEHDQAFTRAGLAGKEYEPLARSGETARVASLLLERASKASSAGAPGFKGQPLLSADEYQSGPSRPPKRTAEPINHNGSGEAMKITVVGTGYVGLVSGVCYAELGHSVICVDKDPLKVATLQNGEIPIYEPGLQELSVRNSELGRLQFTSSLGNAVKGADLIVIAVGTPPLPSGQANLAYIELAAQEIADSMEGNPVIAIKSTVPVGTNEKVRDLIRSHTDCPFDSVSLPEFLREGSAVSDTMNPDRIVIGTESPRAEALLRELHAGLNPSFVVTDIRSAEMIKYASNAFLATKISFINEIANICEKVGADVTQVADGMGHDKRIGASFLKAGIGYGGSCFPKDTQALIQIAGHVDYEFKLLRSVVEVNQDQRYNVIRKLEAIFGELRGRTVAVWGLAFKPETDDVREAPAQEIIGELLARGVEVRAYDPIAMDNFRSTFGSGDGNVAWCDSALEAAAGSDAVCLLTEWKEFGGTDLQLLRAVVREPVLIDGRNAFNEADLQDTDFIYYSVGRPSLARGVKAPVPELSY